MPDLFKMFRSSHKTSKSNGDTLAQDFEGLHISGDAHVSNNTRSSKKAGRVDPMLVANSVAKLTITPQAATGRSHSDQPWVGGFTSPPQQPSTRRNERPPHPENPPSAPAMLMPTPHNYPAQWNEPVPAQPPMTIPMPIPSSLDGPYSLTMQHAVLGDIDLGESNPNVFHSRLQPPPPTVPPRPHTDPTVPTVSLDDHTSISAPPSTPRRQRPNISTQVPQSVPAKLTKANLNSVDTNLPTQKRRRATSQPLSPVSASAASSTTTSRALQCSGRTKHEHHI